MKHILWRPLEVDDYDGTVYLKLNAPYEIKRIRIVDRKGTEFVYRKEKKCEK